MPHIRLAAEHLSDVEGLADHDVMAEDKSAVLQDLAPRVSLLSPQWGPGAGEEVFGQGVSTDVGSRHPHSEEVSNIEHDQKHKRDAHHGVEDTSHLTRQGDGIDVPIT